MLNYWVLVCKLVPIHGGRGKTKEANDSRLVAGRFNKQENLARACMAPLVGILNPRTGAWGGSP